MIWSTRDYVLPLPDAISGATLLGGMIYAKYRFFAAAFAVVMSRTALGIHRMDTLWRDHQGRRAR